LFTPVLSVPFGLWIRSKWLSLPPSADELYDAVELLLRYKSLFGLFKPIPKFWLRKYELPPPALILTFWESFESYKESCADWLFPVSPKK